MKNPIENALGILQQVSVEGAKIALLQEEYAAHMQMWTVAVKKEDKQAENNERCILHTLTDQILDLQAHGLQLVKSFQDLQP